VAELSRTELVRVADSEALDSAPPELASVEVDSHDEIGDLAAAVNRVQSTAAEMLERQATARANVATMFANVSRRTQNLVGRQLSIIEDLTVHAPDPATRERLSQLEHVTTRLRRSADSLMVISGTIDQQFQTMPARLADVIDAALLEIEGFGAVEVVQPVPDLAVPAELGRDLRLLLAELLENATNFTPPGSSVRVGATYDQRTMGESYAPDCVIAVVDNGLGMSPSRIEEENRRLVERERLDVAPTRMLGLFVVGRLARRYGLTVRLDPSPGRGVTAMVRIPARLVGPGSMPAPTALGIVPQRAVAALESASRSGPFGWLGRQGPPAIGAAPVSGVPTSGVPVSAAPVTAPPASYGPSYAVRSVRDPVAEREAVNDYLSGVARAHEPATDSEASTTSPERHQ
jgi:signal transduction histidine kinase